MTRMHRTAGITLEARSSHPPARPSCPPPPTTPPPPRPGARRLYEPPLIAGHSRVVWGLKASEGSTDRSSAAEAKLLFLTPDPALIIGTHTYHEICVRLDHIADIRKCLWRSED
ncbi:hypothetical protein E2C01_003846 [Portunus trituberculatus]|uniref:Uncharacterized protein n=1 Tax=Portunus trituberculatus TaxID=210409 RepID=A0A5B7CPW8_PORTR|nr:hypothetical protein [Portunus trituberculatus]